MFTLELEEDLYAAGRLHSRHSMFHFIGQSLPERFTFLTCLKKSTLDIISL